MRNGYNALYNACQSADMVKIGFLSRVRGFTFRGDLQNYIMAGTEWKANPFHFRLYFDAFTAKGKTAHVLMIDVDRPAFIFSNGTWHIYQLSKQSTLYVLASFQKELCG